MPAISSRSSKASLNASSKAGDRPPARAGQPRRPVGRTARCWTNHVGPIGVFDGKANYSVDWKDLDQGKPENFGISTGWLGFTDKYWLTALVPLRSATASEVPQEPEPAPTRPITRLPRLPLHRDRR